MQDQQINEDELVTLDDDEVAQLALSILIDRHPALVAFEELAAEFANPDPDRAIPNSVIHDGIDELERLGLIHRLDGFFFASHTAMRVKHYGI